MSHKNKTVLILWCFILLCVAFSFQATSISFTTESLYGGLKTALLLDQVIDTNITPENVSWNNGTLLQYGGDIPRLTGEVLDQALPSTKNWTDSYSVVAFEENCYDGNYSTDCDLYPKSGGPPAYFYMNYSWPTFADPIQADLEIDLYHYELASSSVIYLDVYNYSDSTFDTVWSKVCSSPLAPGCGLGEGNATKLNISINDSAFFVSEPLRIRVRLTGSGDGTKLGYRIRDFGELAWHQTTGIPELVNITNGKGLRFSGDNYVNITDSGSLINISEEGSAEIYFNSSSITPQYQSLFQCYSATIGSRFGLLLNYDDITVQIGNYSEPNKYTGQEIEIGEWYHVIFTWDAGDLNMYVNGVNYINNTYTTMPQALTRCHMGASIATPPGYFFNGTIDYLKIFNRTMEPWEIRYRNLTRQDYTISLCNFTVVDEATGLAFNHSNLTTSYLFIEGTEDPINLSASPDYEEVCDIDQDFRYEFTYPNGDVISRFIDRNFTGESQAKICANYYGVPHYEQILLSATNRPAIMQNIYNDCYIAADQTKYAYQGSKILRAFSIDSAYYLRTVDNTGSEVLLASVDGGKETYIDLDNLEFNRQGYNFNIQDAVLTAEKTGTTEITIYYRDFSNKTQELDLSIINMDNDVEVFTYSAWADPNNWTLTFDYSTLSNVSNTTIFKLTADIVETDGDPKTVIKYVNINANLGVLSNGIAIAITLFIALFGITLGATREGMGWLGVFLMIGNIGILSLAAGGWTTNMLMGTYVILMVFFGIMSIKRYSPTISG